MECLNVVTITTKPGLRLQGIEHLKKVTALFKEKFDLPTEVLGNLSGAIYENHVVTRFASLAAFEEFNQSIMADPDYLKWLDEAKDLFHWNDARQSLFNVF